MTRPKGPFRRVERWMVGVVMGIVAFVLEKAVMRSVRRTRVLAPTSDPSTITSKGKDVDLDPGKGSGKV